MGIKHHGKEVKYEQLKAFCRMKPTLADTAAFFEVSEDTIIRRCDEYEGLTFAKFRDKYIVHTRFDLIRRALKQADKSPAIMIFCLKNLCKWTDKVEVAGDGEKPIRLDFNPKDIKKQD